MNAENKVLGEGVRTLKLRDQAPDCEIYINSQLYELPEICSNKKVLDIGCGYGWNKPIVEKVGGEWIGVEPFEGGANTVIGTAEDLPFEDNSFDVVIMDAVLEHVEDVDASFLEISRVLKPEGVFIGYSAFMECFHEISYSHLSFKGIEYYAQKYEMNLESINGGRAFGIDYHLRNLFYPIPFGLARKAIAIGIRGLIRFKSFLGYLGLRIARKYTHEEAKNQSLLYYKINCLGQSNGFDFIIRKK